MSSVGSFFESALTAPGQNAARGQQQNSSTAQQVGIDLLNVLAPTVKAQAQYAGTLEPARQNTVNASILSLTPGALAASGEKQAGAIRSGTNQAIGQIGQQFASQGLSAGAAAGAIADVQNQGTEQANQATAAQFDPQYLNSLRMQLLQTIMGASALPSLQSLSSATSMVYGAPQVQVGQGLGAIVGNALGQWAGGGFKPGGN